MSNSYDAIIIGGGAAGLMCALTAGQRGRSVLVLDHANKLGKKILMSGGGRCNFTNLYVEPHNFLSSNPHFFKSALKQYSQWDFIELVCRHGIPYHEKKLGQLFCDNKSSDILTMLVRECEQGGVTLRTDTVVSDIEKTASGFTLKANGTALQCGSLVVACGGLSIPTLGATGFGYEIARHFGLEVLPTRAALVPFTFTDEHKAPFSELAGASLEVVASCKQQSFTENLLFTHRGLSGPALLQVSSFWREGDALHIDLLPDLHAPDWLQEEKGRDPRQRLRLLLGQHWPKKVVEQVLPLLGAGDGLKSLQEYKAGELQALGQALNRWELRPAGTEGYRTAEVTLGGVNTEQLSSKTMMCQDIEGLFFVGEVVDVTGWLGGFNFQWAWSSGFVAGQQV